MEFCKGTNGSDPKEPSGMHYSAGQLILPCFTVSAILVGHFVWSRMGVFHEAAQLCC